MLEGMEDTGMNLTKLALFLPMTLGLMLSACSGAVTSSTQAGPPQRYTYRVVNAYAHDPEAFTQGLVYDQGVFYEGTGLWGGSSIRKVELETGKVLQMEAIAPEHFGEGIALWGDQLIQLTWRSNVGFVYDRETFAPLHEFSYATEGWGITHDGKRLIASDGTSTLYFWDPATFKEIGRIEVKDGDQPVVRLNELEYVNGEIFANVWQTDRIARIDPTTGRVLGWIDLTGLLNAQERAGTEDVLNGIAYDAQGGRLFVTGKLWPKVFEIELVPTQ